MSEYSSPRLSQSGRIVNGHYYAETALDSFGDCTPGSEEFRIDEIRAKARQMGFESVFDIIPLMLNSRHQPWRKELATFARGGGLSHTYEACRKAGYFKNHKNQSEGAANTDDVSLKRTICESAVSIYRAEWRVLTGDPEMKRPLQLFTEKTINDFSFGDIYYRMCTLAPFFFILLETLVWPNRDLNIDLRTSAKNKYEREQRRHCRYIVMAVSILAHLTTRRFNIVQGFLSIYLYAHQIPKRVFPIFNHLGIATSFDTVHRGLRGLAADCRNTLKSLYASGKGIQVSFDNMQTQRNVRFERQHNRGSLVMGTAGFVAEDSQNSQFIRPDVNHLAAKTLTVADLLPTKDDDNIIERYIQFKVFETFRSWCGANGIEARSEVDFCRPAISPLDPKSSGKIHPLPVYALDEGRIDEVIKIYDEIARDLGLTDENIRKNVIPCKAKHRQSECSPEKQLEWIEPAAGLFHIQLAVLVLLYRTHLGEDKDTISLNRWIKELRRVRGKLWNPQRQLVKDFHRSQDFFNIVLYGHILAYIAHFQGCSDVAALKTKFQNGVAPREVSEMIFALSKTFSQWHTVHTHRNDPVHDGALLFIQHGLLLSNFADAIKFSDPERVLCSLRYFTVWFQGSKHTNYAYETIHLTACLQKIWSPELVAFYKRNMLFNLSGKQGDWLPCDQVNEDIVKENKGMLGDRMTPETDNHVRNVNALLIFTFRHAKTKLARECDAYVSDYHSSAVDASKDIATIANLLLRDNVCAWDVNRFVPESQREIADLFVVGQRTLGETSRLSTYKKMAVRKGLGVWGAENEEGWGPDSVAMGMAGEDDGLPSDSEGEPELLDAIEDSDDED